MWKTVRIAILLLVLLWAAGHTWLERYSSTRWKDPLWVGVFPINADGSPIAQRYVETLDVAAFGDIEAFFEREGQRYGKQVTPPVHVELYPALHRIPPALGRNAGLLGAALWSLELRWFAWRHVDVGGRAPPRIRLFVLYHDPQTLSTVPDSHGLQKGLLGVVHAFADRSMAGSNSIVIAHELLHTLGASDKYAPGTGDPLFPIGFADPNQRPLYPQPRAEIMAVRRALSPGESIMPPSLAEEAVGSATALEIRWTRR